MKPRYTIDDLAKAIDDMLEKMEELLGGESLEFLHAVDELSKKHPVIEEIHESWWRGYVGLGVGRWGGHATGD